MARASRRRAWGSIASVSRNKHVLRWVESTPEGRRRRSRTFYGSYREACAELDRIHVLVGDDPPTPTVGRAWEMWTGPWLQRSLDSGRLARNTVEGYRLSWRLHCEPRWGRVPVDKVEPAAVQEWLLSLSPATAKQALKTMRHVYRHVSDFCDLKRNPFDSARAYEMPVQLRQDGPDVLTGEQLRAVWDVSRGSSVEAPFLLAAYGGCRTGESLGVKVTDVERVERHGMVFAAVDIVRQMPLTGDQPLPDGDLKNAQSVRTVVLPPPASGRLMELCGEHESVWLADRGDGPPMDRGRLSGRWRKMMDGVGVPYIPFSRLRASWRTMAEYEWRLPWDVLETLMGHALPGVSGAHYVRPRREQVVEAACDALAASWDIRGYGDGI